MLEWVLLAKRASNTHSGQSEFLQGFATYAHGSSQEWTISIKEITITRISLIWIWKNKAAIGKQRNCKNEGRKSRSPAFYHNSNLGLTNHYLKGQEDVHDTQEMNTSLHAMGVP